MSAWSKGYSPFGNNKTGKLSIPILQNSLPHSYVIMPALLSHIDSFNSSETSFSSPSKFQQMNLSHDHSIGTKNTKKTKANAHFKSSKEIIYTTKRMKTKDKLATNDMISSSSSLATSSVNETNTFTETNSNIEAYLESQPPPVTENIEPSIHNITYTQYQISTYDMSEKSSPIESSNPSNDVDTLSMINLLPSNPQTSSSLVDQASEYSNFFNTDSTTMTHALTNSDEFAYDTIIEHDEPPQSSSSEETQTITYAISFPSDWQYNIDTMLNCYVLFRNLNNENFTNKSNNNISKIKLKCSVCKKEFSNLNDLIAHKDEFIECKNNIEISNDDDEEEEEFVVNETISNRKSLKRKSLDVNDYNGYFADEDEDVDELGEDDEIMSELSNEDYFDESIESEDEINYMKSKEQLQKPKLAELNQPTTRRKYTKNKNDPKNFSNLICDKCQKICRTRAEILVHRHKHSGKDPECWQCGKKCASFSNLISHVQLHTGEKPYTCQFCGKQFTQDAHLTRHIRLHTGERPFVCNICGKNYKDYSYYKTHLRIHRGERLYKCNFCNKEYYDASYYKKHTRLHTGEKPYMCTVCGRQFHRSDYLKLHSFSHTNERPFNCHICGKGFKMNYNLKLHLKNHDQEQSQMTSITTTATSLSSTSASSNGNDSFYNDSILINNSNNYINTNNLVIEQSNGLTNTTTINLLSSSVSNEMVSFLNEDQNLEFLSK